MELIVKLKQHTPIIHFQWEQAGATLRATELKPKLDRYIKAKYHIPNKERMRYSVKIKSTSTPPLKAPNKRGLYFGDIGRTGSDKREIHEDMLELVFNTYFNTTLKKQIEESLPICLALENFGTRNNKGFGCYFIEGKRKDEFEQVLKTNAPSEVYYWDCDKNNYFFSIKTIYSLLKSGINLRDRNGNKTYYKSLLFCYFKKRNITWDKKAIKLHFGLTTRNDDKWRGDDEKFVRVFLGMGNVQEWKIPYKKTLNIMSDEFERVPSPLIFKVFNDGKSTVRVYFWARTDFYENLLNKTFTFSVNTNKEQLKLSTPSSFDLRDYLQWAVNEINCNLTINSSMAEFGIVKETNDILNFIKTNKIKTL